MICEEDVQIDTSNPLIIFPLLAWLIWDDSYNFFVNLPNEEE